MNTTFTKSVSPADALRFRFHHEIRELYRHLCDELAESDLSDKEMNPILETLLTCRHHTLISLVPLNELNRYMEFYPED